MSKSMILQFLGAIWQPGDVRELRAFDSRKYVSYGYFDSPETLASAAAAMIATHTIYVTLNPVKPALLARCCNRIKQAGKDPLTTDQDILEQRFTLIDTDPARPAGISASDAEKAEAEKQTRQIMTELGTPVLAGDSGNGYHLIYRNAHGTSKLQIKALLERLAGKYNSTVLVDTTVYNPARITKLLGTRAMKGDHTSERPHRPSSVLQVYEAPVELAFPPLPEPPAKTAKIPITTHTEKFELENALGAHVKTIKTEPTRTIYTLHECPFDNSHKGGEASVIQDHSGKICFQCFHNSCQGRTWHDVKAVMGIETKRTECRHCGERCEWGQDPSGKWRLFSGIGSGDLHLCRASIENDPEPEPEPQVHATFPITTLPDELATFCLETARSIHCPVDYPAIATLSALSILVGQSEIEIKPGWTERPNLYLAIVAPSGSGKTPAIDAVMRLSIYQIAQEQITDNDESRRDYEARCAIHDCELARWKQDKRSGIELTTPPSKPDLPRQRAIFTTDATTEALAELLSQNPDGILVLKDELTAWIKSLDQYKQSGKGADREFFLSNFSGAPIVIHRKTKAPLFVEKPRLSVLGGIVPDNLKLLSGNGGDGFFERIAAVYPTPTPKKFDAIAVSETTINAASRVFSQSRQTRHVKLDQSAQDLFALFYESSFEGEYESYKPKLVAITARIALLLCCAAQKNTCDAHTINSAITIANYLDAHIQRVKDLAGTSQEMSENNALIEWAKRRGLPTIKIRDLCRAGVAGCTSAKRAKEKMLEVVDLGRAVWVTPDKEIKIL